MANIKDFYTRIQLKHDVESAWATIAATFTPLAGEVIIYDVDDTYDYPRIKIGDGTTKLANLPFLDDGAINEMADALSSLKLSGANNKISLTGTGVSDTGISVVGSGKTTATVTGNVLTITSTDSDENVKRTANTGSTALPLIFAPSTSAETSGVYFNTGVTVTPSSKTITATTFKGALDGNAKTATNATHATTADSATNADNAATAGLANEASSLTTKTAGATNKPVYFDGGIPKAISYEINKSVPANAVFTDTHYDTDIIAGTKDATANGTSVTNPYIIVKDNNTNSGQIQLAGSGLTSITATGGVVTVGTNLQNLTFGNKTYNGTSAQSITAADLGLSQAMRFLGTSSTAITDGGAEKPTINSTAVTPKAGDVVLYGNKEFVYNSSSKWELLGDEGSYALKTVQVVAGDGLTGGGAISGNVSITHADTSSQASVTANGRKYITGVTLDGFGHVTGLTTGTETVVHHNTNLVAGATGATANATSSVTNPYLATVDNGKQNTQIQIKGGGRTSVTANGGIITINTPNHASAGGTTQPVYFNASGEPVAIGYTIKSNVPSGAKFTDTVTTAETTGEGNAVTAITATNGKLTVTKGTSFATTAELASVANSYPSKIATGTTNGTISVTVGGTATDVAVKGLGSAAYKEEGTFAPKAHASTATTYGTGTASKYGHVKLYDGLDASSGKAAANGVGASAYSVYLVKKALDDKAAADAALPFHQVTTNDATNWVTFNCGTSTTVI